MITHLFHGYGWDTFCGLRYSNGVRDNYPHPTQVVLFPGDSICEKCRSKCIEVCKYEPGMMVYNCSSEIAVCTGELILKM